MKLKECIFCNKTDQLTVIENQYAYARFDGYPVTKGHTLIIPRQHYETYFDMPQVVKDSCWELVEKIRELMLKGDKTITGINVGFNSGKSAGQSVMHCHIHVIPRRDGDMKDPKGGVRHVIPEKGKY